MLETFMLREGPRPLVTSVKATGGEQGVQKPYQGKWGGEHSPQYYCMDGIQFNWLGFDQTREYAVIRTKSRRIKLDQEPVLQKILQHFHQLPNFFKQTDCLNKTDTGSWVCGDRVLIDRQVDSDRLMDRQILIDRWLGRQIE